MVNLGLQPQYPIVWSLTIVLFVLAVLGVVTEYVLYKRRKAKRREQAKVDFEQEHKEWERRRDDAARDLELFRKAGAKDAVMPYVPREPQFTIRESAYEPEPGFLITGLASFVSFLGLLAASLVMSYPFSAKYQDFYAVTGTVDQVQPSLTLGEKTSSAWYTVSLAGDTKRYGMGDPTIATLKGQQVTLLCHVGWNNQAADSWVCDLRTYEGSTR